MAFSNPDPWCPRESLTWEVEATDQKAKAIFWASLGYKHVDFKKRRVYVEEACPQRSGIHVSVGKPPAEEGYKKKAQGKVRVPQAVQFTAAANYF